jgi:hypothetical protein
VKAQKRINGAALHIFLTSVLGGVGGQRHHPVAFLKGRKASTHFTAGCVDHRDGLDGGGKLCPYSG